MGLAFSELLLSLCCLPGSQTTFNTLQLNIQLQISDPSAPISGCAKPPGCAQQPSVLVMLGCLQEAARVTGLPHLCS